MLFLTDFDFIG